MFQQKLVQQLIWILLIGFVVQSCTDSREDDITTIGKIEIKGDGNPLRTFDFILIKDSSIVTKPVKNEGYWDCDGDVITYCRLGLINHVREIYFLDYSCTENFGLSTTNSIAKIFPQLMYCNANWSLQRTLKLGDTLFTNFRVCSEKDSPVQFEWLLPLFEKKEEGESFFKGAVKRDWDEVYDTLKLVSKKFYL